MTLPCSSATDSRSVPVTTLKENAQFEVLGTIENSLGNTWYITQWEGERCYVYSGYAGFLPPEPEEPQPRQATFWEQVLGWFRGGGEN